LQEGVGQLPEHLIHAQSPDRARPHTETRTPAITPRQAVRQTGRRNQARTGLLLGEGLERLIPDLVLIRTWTEFKAAVAQAKQLRGASPRGRFTQLRQA
jgi:hypothetical protein